MRALVRLVLLAALFSGLSAAPAAAKVVEIPAVIVVETEAHPGPNDPGRCLAMSLLRFADHEDASVYTGVVYNASLRADQTFTGPPFDDEARYGQMTVTAPSGAHQFFLSAASGGRGCEQVGGAVEAKHKLVRMTADIDGPPTIKGRVVDEDGIPLVDRVKITARGPRTLSAGTNSDGRYEIEVPRNATGRYSVTPAAKGIEFEPAKRTVTVRRASSATANFRASAGCSARPSQAVLRPRQGLYLDRTRPGLRLNYSCRSRLVVAAASMNEVDWDGCSGSLVWRSDIYGDKRVYSKRMPVSDSGRFAGLPIGRGSRFYRFTGAFTSREDAHVDFEFRDCNVRRDAPRMIWLGDGGDIRF